MMIAIDSPRWLAVALPIVALAILLIWRAAAPLPHAAKVLATLAAVLVGLAAGQPHWTGSGDDARDVAVLVDLSPSTRTATYRDRAALERRVGELLGNRPHRTYFFADGLTPTAPPGDVLPDIAAGRTAFAPPAEARAVLVFTDARFDPPANAPPTFVVIDPALDRPPDARVAALDVRDGTLHATLANTGPPRELTWTGVTADEQKSLATATYMLAAPLAPGAARAGLQVVGGADAWPENDAMATVVPPPPDLQRWWVGGGDPGAGWTRVAPASLATDATDFLRAGAIVLHNVPAGALSLQQQSRLSAYVRETGGTLVLLGGDRAFAAGGYTGTLLDSLSPLASNPPTPSTQWIVLTDASGSMASDAGDTGTRFDAAVGAVRALLRGLPPDDTVTVGAFARDVQWWSTGRTVGDTPPSSIPPASAASGGPTNLAAAVDALADAPASGTRHVFLITDGGADPLDATAVARRLAATSSTLSVLSIGNGPATASLARVAAATGGSVVTEPDPARWQRAAGDLLRAAGPARVERSTVRVTFSGELASLGFVDATVWNRAWPRTAATVVATGDLPDTTATTNSATTEGASSATPLAAWWAAGLGRVVAVAFDASPDVAATVTDLLARPPRDARFTVTWSDESGATRVRVDAVDNGRPLNRAALSVGGPFAGDAFRAIPQVAPGRYELTFDPPPQPAVATILLGGQVVDRHALAGHYAPEFTAIGNDHPAMRDLAARSGGAVVTPSTRGPIVLPQTSDRTPLAPWLATLAAILISASLIVWRVDRGAGTTVRA